MHILLFALLLIVCISLQANAGTYDLEMPSGDNYARAAFRYRQPEDIATIKAVVVLVPGLNADERDMVDDPCWQTFARLHGFALLACYFANYDSDGPRYRQADLGSGKALIEALGGFAKKTCRPEVENAPLILWGHSAGGQFNYEFACWKPERVAAFIVNKGGYYHTMNPSAETRNIPALFFIGAKDEEFRIKNITEIFHSGRDKGALWALAVEPDSGHEIGGTRELAMWFFETIIPLRLKANSELAELTGDSGWVGDNSTFEIKPAESSTNHVGSWLPNGLMARRWRDFATGKNDAPAK